MDEPYKTYFPHIFGLKSLQLLFQLYLIIVRAMCQKTLNWVNHVYLPSQNKEHCIVLYCRVASGAPWAVKGLPYPFSIIGLLCKYSVSDRSTPFQKQFRPRLDVSSSSRRFNSQSSMQSPAQLRQIRSISLSLFTFQSMCWASEAFTR